jgi:hypothetical protein
MMSRPKKNICFQKSLKVYNTMDRKKVAIGVLVVVALALLVVGVLYGFTNVFQKQAPGFRLGDLHQNPWTDASADPMVPPLDNTYLQRQNIQCDKGSALNWFQLNRTPDASNKISYNYGCTVPRKDMVSADKSTPIDDRGGPTDNLIYLDRHNIECAQDEVLTSLQLQQQGDSKIFYKYGCAKKPWDSPLQCRDVRTDFTDQTRPLGSLFDLTQQKVQCNPDEAMSRARFTRSPDGTQIAYEYRCCKA